MPAIHEKLHLLERRLLDTSRRNKLIHCTATRRGFVQLTEPGIQTLYEDLVVNRKQLTFKRAVSRDFDPVVFSLLSLMEMTGTPLDVAVGDIKTAQDSGELERTLQVLLRKTRTLQAEKGQHVLYLALAFVRWSDHGVMTNSPLLLLPVVLNRSSSPAIYSISADDVPVVNPTLVHLFAERFRYSLPEYNGTPASYFECLQTDFAQHGWTLVQECRLGVFAFQRMALYHDVRQHADRFLNNPVIQRLYGEEVLPAEGRVAPMSPACMVLSADSSQAEAVAMSRNGETFILKGPPGTGKSQTAVNMISANLADGKKILFVSQKKAAIDVVHKRLIKAGLGRFALAIHDTSQTNKHKIIRELGESLGQRVVSRVPDACDTAGQLILLEDKQIRYLRQLHQVRQPMGITLADAFAKVSVLADAPSVSIPFDNVAKMDRVTLLFTLDKLTDIAAAVQFADLWGAMTPAFHHGDLGPVVAALEAARVSPEDYARAYEKAFYIAWIGLQLADAPDVAFFNSDVYTTNVAHYRAVLERSQATACVELKHQLSSRIQSKLPLLRTEEAILQMEFQKKSRHLPIRKLFSHLPQMLQVLKPIMLMSPVALAEYVDPAIFEYDLVIFDEASQLLPEDAIGALLRTKQAVICGDTMQMPPTSFFTSTELPGDDEDDVLPAGASLLEEAMYKLPETSLLWHYRSEAESLIAFSNDCFYHGRLQTFPQARLEQSDTGVEYIYVPNAIYENQRNHEEAIAAVRLVFEHIQSYPRRSLGVIAFSVEQQDEIESELLKERAKHPEHEAFFSEEGAAPFFIKNLENVQGDERDTIILSVGYGHSPDDGRFRLNFGPISLAGGSRRLNVAITRSRMNLKILCSVKPAEIDLDRAHSEGARVLREYLDYASRNGRQISQDNRKNAVVHLPFVDTVAALLEQAGYAVEKSIGLSDCKVDIGIRAPDGSGYAVGILCDGGNNANISPADDVIRRGMLARLGWLIIDAYSVEWARNPVAAQKALLQRVQDAMNGLLVAPVISSASVEVEYEPELVSVRSKQNLSLYIPAVPGSYTYQMFIQQDYPQLTYDQGMILHYIRKEAPLHMSVLYQRMAPCYGRQKATAFVRDETNKALQRLLNKYVCIIEEAFLVLKYEQTVTPRQAGEREIDHISLCELGEVMKIVIRQMPGIDRAQAIQDASTMLGFARTGQRVEERLQHALGHLESRREIHNNGGRLFVREEKHNENAD